MNTIFFFDDQLLFAREGLERDYGCVSEIPDSVFFDGQFSTDYRTGFVFKTGAERYDMVYFGKRASDRKIAALIARSEDGVHFVPRNTESELSLSDRVAPNQILSLSPGSEIADVFEDPFAPEDEKYKMLLTQNGDPLCIEGLIYVSGDLVSWKKKNTRQPWNGGCEPITGVFYNRVKHCYTVLRRPFWGKRIVGYVETTDWNSFSDFEPCMQTDALDSPLDEMYGMTAMDYHGVFIGFNVIYGGLQSALHAKFSGGSIFTELSYSSNGRNWQRSLRKPFLPSGFSGDSMLWLSCAYEDNHDNVIFCASFSPYPHGEGFSHPGLGRIRFFRMRKDGFVRLIAQNNIPGTVATRECLFGGGELHVNLSAENATAALYETCDEDGVNLLAFSKPVPYFGHGDCVPFSGDSTDWIPKFRGGNVDSLKGKTLIIEIRLTNGSIYSISGDLTPLYNTEAARYRQLGVLPQ